MRVYLASPYTSTSKSEQLERFVNARNKTAELMHQGYVVFSPIAYSHQFHTVHCMPGDWSFWEMHDTAFIEWADEFWVLMLPGWQESRGIQAELSIAGRLGKAIRYLEA